MSTQRDRTPVTADALEEFSSRVENTIVNKMRRIAREMRDLEVPEVEVTGYKTVIGRYSDICRWLSSVEQAMHDANEEILKAASGAIKAAVASCGKKDFPENLRG